VSTHGVALHAAMHGTTILCSQPPLDELHVASHQHWICPARHVDVEQERDSRGCPAQHEEHRQRASQDNQVDDVLEVHLRMGAEGRVMKGGATRKKRPCLPAARRTTLRNWMAICHLDRAGLGALACVGACTLPEGAGVPLLGGRCEQASLTRSIDGPPATRTTCSGGIAMKFWGTMAPAHVRRK
jgi:hypothetical protein